MTCNLGGCRNACSGCSGCKGGCGGSFWNECDSCYGCSGDCYGPCKGYCVDGSCSAAGRK